MAGTELPLLGAAIKIRRTRHPADIFQKCWRGKLQPVIPTLQRLSNFMAGLVNLFAAEQKVADSAP